MDQLWTLRQITDPARSSLLGLVLVLVPVLLLAFVGLRLGPVG